MVRWARCLAQWGRRSRWRCRLTFALAVAVRPLTVAVVASLGRVFWWFLLFLIGAFAVSGASVGLRICSVARVLGSAIRFIRLLFLVPAIPVPLCVVGGWDICLGRGTFFRSDSRFRCSRVVWCGLRCRRRRTFVGSVWS